MSENGEIAAGCGNCANYHRGYCEYFDMHWKRSIDDLCSDYCGHGKMPPAKKNETKGE